MVLKFWDSQLEEGVCLYRSVTPQSGVMKVAFVELKIRTSRGNKTERVVQGDERPTQLSKLVTEQ